MVHPRAFLHFVSANRFQLGQIAMLLRRLLCVSYSRRSCTTLRRVLVMVLVYTVVVMVVEVVLMCSL